MLLERIDSRSVTSFPMPYLSQWFVAHWLKTCSSMFFLDQPVWLWQPWKESADSQFSGWMPTDKPPHCSGVHRQPVHHVQSAYHVHPWELSTMSNVHPWECHQLHLPLAALVQWHSGLVWQCMVWSGIRCKMVSRFNLKTNTLVYRYRET